MPLDDDTIEELALSPRKVTTDEGSVEERSIKEVIQADNHVAAKEVGNVPFHGLRHSRFKPGSAV